MVKSTTSILFLCDWLPPDFGAVGQYTIERCREMAESGQRVVLIGFTTDSSRKGMLQDRSNLEIERLYRPAYDKSDLFSRATWTLRANWALVRAAIRNRTSVEEVWFTGSPPYLLHFIGLANLLLRRRLIYRITDFHPECLMAATQSSSFPLRAVYAMTLFWRRRVSRFEAIGEDQVRRLSEGGIPIDRITVRRDPSPVSFSEVLQPRPRPPELEGKFVILYSGNWGVAHDHQTFLAGYEKFVERTGEKAVLWLNAVGKRAGQVAELCRERGLPMHRTQPCPLTELSALLISVDLHLITLSDEFVGYVLPSKVYACIESRRPVLYVGSERSDVDLLCNQRMLPAEYRRAAVTDSGAVAAHLNYFFDKFGNRRI